jgi:DNA modification methylase
MLSDIPINDNWSFSDKTIKHTAYITHGYYTYPAKFIPQLAAKIINEYSEKDDIVIDPFMGSGTTVIEAIVNARIGIGTDINEIAVLIAQVKSTPINYNLLVEEYAKFIDYFQQHESLLYQPNITETIIKLPERVDYWFKPNIKQKLILILQYILQIKCTEIKYFFMVAFAQILKSCSVWLQKSIKPTRDLHKQDVESFEKMLWQLKRMLKKHQEFMQILPESVKNNIAQFRQVTHNDARQLPCDDEKASLIVTSPPYVTSYEYADLHQLPCLWFGYLNELADFRPKFIGSTFRKREEIDLKSDLAQEIVYKLGTGKKAEEVKHYFADMLECFIEMHRVLKSGGKTTIVIGNTKLKGVDILNAEVFKQQLEQIGFKTHDIIQREIPSKMLPSTRDPKNGRFTKANNAKKSLAYPTEYILIMEKR